MGPCLLADLQSEDNPVLLLHVSATEMTGTMGAPTTLQSRDSTFFKVRCIGPLPF